MSNRSIRPIDSNLSGGSTLGLCGPESSGSEEVPYIPQSSRAGGSPSVCFVSYIGHSLREFEEVPVV